MPSVFKLPNSPCILGLPFTEVLVSLSSGDQLSQAVPAAHIKVQNSSGNNGLALSCVNGPICIFFSAYIGDLLLGVF